MSQEDKGEPRDEPGFVVVDKRGREREADAEAAAAPPPPQEAPSGADEPQPRGPRPKVDFVSLAISLGTSAMVHLGLIPDPETQQPREKDLELARQAIDTLEMLQEKTRGNLDAEEAGLLQRLLTDLRMRFVEARR